MINFCHIHVHSTYSVLDGLGTPDGYAKKASEMGFEYLACTDHGNIDSLIKWQKACLKYKIKPILGSELYIVPDARIKTKEKRGHIVLLCKNANGWKTLCNLLTYANIDGFYYKPRIDYKKLLESDLSGLIITTACVGSFIHLDGGLDLLSKLNDRMPDDLFLEIMPHNIESQKKHNQEILEIHSKTGTPLICSNDTHYVNKDEWKAQEVLLSIQTKDKWSNPDRWRFGFEGLYLRSYDEMMDAFSKHSYISQSQILIGMRNTIKIAKKCCDFRIEKRDINLPLPEQYKGNPDDVLFELIEKGKENLLKSKYINEIEYDDYRNRLDFEFNIIKQKKFSSYILIIKDFIDWCNENNVLSGPGRGSAAGSLISFVLGITKIDPIKYGLLFERFIAIDRNDFPDIDIDIQDDKREMAKAYFERVYGHTNIAGISTFNSMNSRGVIRDVCRVFDVPYDIVDKVAKAIDPKDEDGIKNALENNDIVSDFDSQFPGIIELCLTLEGQVRAGGQHAAGVVVSDEDLYSTDKCNLCVRSGQIVVNWDKDDAEYMGLIKIDILGIKTLTVLKGTQELIEQNYNKKIDLNKIPLEDDRVFKELSNGKTTGVFQLNTLPTTKLTQDIGVRYFMDIADILALVRPGPFNSGMTGDYIKRKKDSMNNKYWEGKHRIYEEITKDSYGICCYQEQVMYIISKLAGLPFSVADKIRKIIGKKRDPKEFEQYWKMFLEGCLENRTMDEDEAEKFWQGLQEWSSYGFSKCLSGDTLLTRSSYNQYTGKHISIKDLYLNWYQNTPVGQKYQRQGLDILQMNGDFRCRPGKVIGVYYNGKKTIYEVITESGKKIKGTLNHRLYTYDGYKEISELNIGDRIAAMGSYQIKTKDKAGNIRKEVHTKGQRGFQEGINNPSYIDGRTKYFNENKQKVYLRAMGKCEMCGCTPSDENGEIAHINSPVDFFKGDYFKYHSHYNLLYLCCSCHSRLDYKKNERKKRYYNGYPIYYDPIVSINYMGEEDVFDVEMLGPDHNFIANDIVSHNSHAVGYAVISMWTAWFKTYYPLEFFCSLLTYGAKTNMNEIISEIRRMGFDIAPPEIGVSDSKKWIAKNNKLYIPFMDVKGIGDSVASELSNTKKKDTKVGFLTKEVINAPVINPTSKIAISLDKIKKDFYNGNFMEIRDLFDFNIGCNYMLEYPNLYAKIVKSTFPNYEEIVRDYDKMESMIRGEHIPLNRYIKRIKQSEITIKCSKCELFYECTNPVSPSVGKYNIMIIGEAPGKREDYKKIGFIGKAGSEILWPELKLYGLKRELFYVSNICKCWPRQTKTPKINHIDICMELWLKNEIKYINPILILALGKTPLLAFKGEEKGIIQKNGTTEWIDSLSAWVCWCVHPASVLYNSKNRGLFEQGILNFVNKIPKEIK